MLYGRKTRTLIPCWRRQGVNSDINEKRRIRKKSVQKCHDRHARDLPELRIGQTVYFELRENAKWIVGKVNSKLGERTYLVKGANGGTYRRNRVQMRPTNVRFYETQQPDLEVDIPVITPEKPDDVTESHDNNPETTTTDNTEVITANARNPEGLRRSTRRHQRPYYLKDYVT
ncbi:Uncharacterised protein r2_g3611 [Pycnogonum litorale]